MILGIGTDLLDVSRMEAELAGEDHGLRDSIFTPSEIAYCEGCRYPARHFAARFAAKEALLKALGSAGPSGFYWREIEVLRQPNGSPSIALSGRLADIAARAGVRGIHVSLSHTPDLASATVLIES